MLISRWRERKKSAGKICGRNVSAKGRQIARGRGAWTRRDRLGYSGASCQGLLAANLRPTACLHAIRAGHSFILPFRRLLTTYLPQGFCQNTMPVFLGTPFASRLRSAKLSFRVGLDRALLSCCTRSGISYGNRSCSIQSHDLLGPSLDKEGVNREVRI